MEIRADRLIRCFSQRLELSARGRSVSHSNAHAGHTGGNVETGRLFSFFRLSSFNITSGRHTDP